MSSQIPLNIHGLLSANNDYAPSPMLSLPDEILCMVLDIVAELEPPGTGRDLQVGDYGRNRQLGFLRLSEVCRRFRAMLLSMHVLWAATVFELPRQPAALALARSHVAPMDVHITHLDGWKERRGTTRLDANFEYHVTAAGQQTSRIRSLQTLDLESMHHKILFANPLPLLSDIHLTYTVPTNPFVALKDIYIDAPLLKTIRLEFQNEDHSVEDDIEQGLDSEQGLSFFNQFDRGIAFRCPALRVLIVNLELLHAKTNLKAGWVVDLLCHSPLLELIDITLCTSSSRIQWISLFGGRAAPLVHLQNLTLDGSDSANLPDLFACIHPAPSIRCSVTYCHFKFGDNLVASLFNFIDFFVPMLRREVQDGLRLAAQAFPNYAVIDLASFPALSDPMECDSYLEDGASGSFQLCIEFEDQGLAEQGEPIVARIADALALRCDKTQLIVKVAHPVWFTALDTIMKSCSAVKELVVYYHWDHDSPSPSLLPSSSDFLPNLDTMLIKFPYVWDGKNLVQPLRKHLIAWREHLAVWLGRRAEVRLRIRRLHLLEAYTNDGAAVEENNDADATFCAQVAEFVDELVAERVCDED